ncbi:MAG: PAS domain S-box protein [Synechococcales cyanobacterium RU_4_20]|nr:PAS domain S-box protein [Synechococcales cyanobacterium RU_4_20]NJR67547.1 PAS domain S-box protein [Synechococcales cyanobacterium CRU_2_2]
MLKIVPEVSIIGFENRCRCQDGSYRWLLWSATFYAESGILYAIARDITSQKKIEKRLNNKVQ